MSIKIEKKIVSYSVVEKIDEQKDEKKEIPAEVVQDRRTFSKTRQNNRLNL